MRIRLWSLIFVSNYIITIIFCQSSKPSSAAHLSSTTKESPNWDNPSNTHFKNACDSPTNPSVQYPEDSGLSTLSDSWPVWLTFPLKNWQIFPWSRPYWKEARFSWEMLFCLAAIIHWVCWWFLSVELSPYLFLQ
jgi:hypothetical protein